MGPRTMSVRVTGTCWEAQPLEGTFGWLRGVDLNHRPLGYEPNDQSVSAFDSIALPAHYLLKPSQTSLVLCPCCAQHLKTSLIFDQRSACWSLPQPTQGCEGAKYAK